MLGQYGTALLDRGNEAVGRPALLQPGNEPQLPVSCIRGDLAVDAAVRDDLSVALGDGGRSRRSLVGAGPGRRIGASLRHGRDHGQPGVARDKRSGHESPIAARMKVASCAT
jgi:hypothetical protein